MKLRGFSQKSQHRGLRLRWLGLLLVAVGVASPASSATNHNPLVQISALCSVDAANEWQASLNRLIESQADTSIKVRETLYGFYLPEIAKLVSELPNKEREQLAPDILAWLTPSSFERGLDLKSKSTDALSPEEVSDLIGFESCWQSLLGYVLTINPEFNERLDLLAGHNLFNEPLSQVAKVDTNRYLVFLVNGTIKLSEILRSSNILMTLAQKQRAQICAPLRRGHTEESID